MPRLLVVVHSGKITIGRLGYFETRDETSTRVVPGAGLIEGGAKARRMACKREMCSTCFVFG